MRQRQAEDLVGGTTLVVGLGVTGWSVVQALARCGVNIKVADSRNNPPALNRLRRTYPEIEYQLGPFEVEWFLSANRIVVSPGVGLDSPAIVAATRRKIPVFGDIELFAQLVDGPVVAITGSNGKSTVTELFGQMAAQTLPTVAVGGNLGLPALDLLPKPDQVQPDLYVLELSSFQLESCASLCPQVATVLNVSPDHMDRYPSVRAYADAKQRIFSNSAHAVINRDDPHVTAMINRLDCPRSEFGIRTPTLVYERDVRRFSLIEINNKIHLACDGEAWLAVDQLGPGLTGRHNWANALAAMAMGSALNLSRGVMCAALLNFRGLPHRCERVLEAGGVCWIDDSKGTNVGATVAAIHGLPGPLVLIAGGDAKQQDFAPLGAALAATNKLRSLIVLGQDGPAIAAVVPASVPVFAVDSMEQAVDQAAELVQSGDTVLLSPACASFDMFTNYVERGRAFQSALLARRG